VALNDVRPVNPSDVPCGRFRTEAGATAILAGEPVKIGGTGSNYVVPLADAEPTTSADIMGIASSNSTQTASADGYVDVWLADPSVEWSAKAESAAAVDTEAEILGLLNDIVAFNLAAGVYTVATGSAASTNGLRITGGNASQGTVTFRILNQASSLNT